MSFAEHLQDHQLATLITDMVDLPVFEDFAPQIQSPSYIVKKDMERLLFQVAQELSEWAEHMKAFGSAEGQQAQAVEKILANPQGAAQALVRNYVINNVKSA